MTVTIELAADIEEQLHKQAAASGTTAESFVVQSGLDRLKRLRHRSSPPVGKCLSKEESRLMMEINRGPSETTWERHRELNQKRRDETITPDERAEFLMLNDLIEEDHARRLQFVSALAKLRGTTLEALMKELGLWRVADV